MPSSRKTFRVRRKNASPLPEEKFCGACAGTTVNTMPPCQREEIILAGEQGRKMIADRLWQPVASISIGTSPFQEDNRAVKRHCAFRALPSGLAGRD
jgi:hypothetical protein